jgi:hypothetical protein
MKYDNAAANLSGFARIRQNDALFVAYVNRSSGL